MLPPADAAAWKHRLSHVRWIGGPPDAGKSTVALLLGAACDIPVYRQDGHEMEHLRRADPVRFPHNFALREQVELDEDAFFEHWVRESSDTLAAEATAIWTERLPMICEDILALSPASPCIVEGPGLFPAVVRPLLQSPHQAIWLIPSERFKRDSHARRDKTGWGARTSNPDLALHHHIERDLQLAQQYRDELEPTDRSLTIDGHLPETEIARQVGTWFGLNM